MISEEISEEVEIFFGYKRLHKRERERERERRVGIQVKKRKLTCIGTKSERKI